MNYSNNNFTKGKSKKSKLPASYAEALNHLFYANRGKTEKEKKDAEQWRKEEPVFFTLYLNFAVNNIVTIAGLDANMFEPDKIVSALSMPEKEKSLEALAHFFWLFNVENPERDFKDWKRITLSIVKQIYHLRNTFTHHADDENSKAFIIDRNLYVLLEGLLKTQGCQAVLRENLNTSKVSKLKLANPHENRESRIEEKYRTYELTRKGLIFLTCLALYKDDATEFCMLFHDMRKEEVETDDGSGDMRQILPVKKKSLITLFTEFSMRRGRNNLDLDDPLFLAFADITGYLNKVPLTSYNFLSLDAETAKMNKLYDASTESEENKLEKYRLHRRKKDRFLSFCAAYCEDFDVLPDLKFKRLDITPGPGRKQYLFGKEAGSSTRQNRHYVIKNNAIHFEFRPAQHYGDIHVNALRSQISESEFKKLLTLTFRKKLRLITEKAVRDYFTAYHRILETILNATTLDAATCYTTQMKKDLSTISGHSIEELDKNLALLDGVLPRNIRRIFCDDEMRPTLAELRDALIGKLDATINHGEGFLNRAYAFIEWVNDKTEKRSKVPPVCNADEVWHPPRECRISDSEKISAVFTYLNSHLADARKFRQLPRGEQHRGPVDFEYQTVHALIGKFTLEQNNLWRYLEKFRPELHKPVALLKDKVNKIKNEDYKKHPKYHPITRKPIDPPTLLHLAMAATDVYLDQLQECGERWSKRTRLTNHQEELKRDCRLFGIKTGMPLDRASVIKSILHLDEAKWKNAYDYSTGKKYENRMLPDTGHIVSQIPFPNGMADRLLRTAIINDRNQYGKLLTNVKAKDGGITQTLNFSLAIRTWTEQNTSNTALRDYYNIAPLLEYQKKNRGKLSREFIPGTAGVNPPNAGYEPLYDYSKAGLTKAIRDIKNVHCQDMLLLNLAWMYRARYQGTLKIQTSRDLSVYSWFTDKLNYQISYKNRSNIRISTHPHDVTRFIFSQVCHKKIIPKLIAYFPQEQTVFDFYELAKKYREIQAKDRAARIKMIDKLLSLERVAKIHPNIYKVDPKESEDARIAQKEFKCYHRIFPLLEMEDYECLRDIRNQIMHDGFDLNIAPAEAVLTKIGF